MLAQSFKTHQDLNLDERVYEGLKKVLVRLETGDLVWVHGLDVSDMFPIPENGFNMDWDFLVRDCGTVGCIGGWTAYEANLDMYSVMEIEELSKLFYPNQIKFWERITVEQAATVLRHYLTTGKINWDMKE